MPTLTNSVRTRPSSARTPTLVHRLWEKLPTPVRAPVLEALSQMLARQWRSAVGRADRGNRSGEQPPCAARE